jgi:hypothetical protein
MRRRMGALMRLVMGYYRVLAHLHQHGALEDLKPVRVRRARYPAGHEKAGQFVPNDPATEVNEAWVKQ